jgi:hypothetical protein
MDVRTVEDFFAGKPETLQPFRTIADRIDALGPCQVTVASQISFGTSVTKSCGGPQTTPISPP